MMLVKSRLLLSLLSITLFLANISHTAVCSVQIPVKFLYTVDGDTLKVMYNGEKESVRLIGIDTPESRNNRKADLQSKEMNTSTYNIIQM